MLFVNPLGRGSFVLFFFARGGQDKTGAMSGDGEEERGEGGETRDLAASWQGSSPVRFYSDLFGFPGFFWFVRI